MDPQPTLRTRRLRLDPLNLEDAPAVFAYRSLPEVGNFQSFEPTTLSEVEAFIGRQPPSFDLPGTWFQLAIRERRTQDLLGDAGVHFVGEHQAELGVTISPEHQRQGFAAEALSALLDHLFGGCEKHRVFASVDPRNTASMALLKRVGMRQEAHHRESLWFKGAWVDDVVFALLRTEWQQRG